MADTDLIAQIYPYDDSFGYTRTALEASKRHFALYNHLIVRDVGSTCGTIVTYDGQGKGQSRSQFDWIIDKFEPIMLCLLLDPLTRVEENNAESSSGVHSDYPFSCPGNVHMFHNDCWRP